MGSNVKNWLGLDALLAMGMELNKGYKSIWKQSLIWCYPSVTQAWQTCPEAAVILRNLRINLESDVMVIYVKFLKYDSDARI